VAVAAVTEDRVAVDDVAVDDVAVDDVAAVDAAVAGDPSGPARSPGDPQPALSRVRPAISSARHGARLPLPPRRIVPPDRAVSSCDVTNPANAARARRV